MTARPSDFIGVVHPLVWDEWKRAALLFDRLVVEYVDVATMWQYQPDPAESEARWLLEQGVIESFTLTPFHPKEDEYYSALTLRNDELRATTLSTNDVGAVDLAILRHCDTATRDLARFLRTPDVDVMPVVSGFGAPISGGVDADVARAVLEGIPTIDDSVPWEYIVEFRHEDAVRLFHRDLRNWVARQVRENIPAREIAGEVESAVARYRAFLGKRGIPHWLGKLDMVLGVTGAISAWGVNPLVGIAASVGVVSLAVRLHRAELLQDELSAPGSHLAYIARVQGRFGR